MPRLHRFLMTPVLVFLGIPPVVAVASEANHEWLTAHGVQDWFHTPFAWFGDRTAFRGFTIPLQFFPTNRRLREGRSRLGPPRI